MPSGDNPAVSREPGDVNVMAIAGIAFGLVIAVMIINLLLLLFFGYLSARESRAGRAMTPWQSETEIPPAPRLRVSPRSDLAEMQAAEQTILHSYGWIDKERGIVRIPIEEAMELVAKQGLPVRKQAPSPPSSPVKRERK